MKNFMLFNPRNASIFVLCGLALTLSGCPQYSDGTVIGTPVDVTVREFSVNPEVGSVAAGELTFRVRNAGIVAHEFLVIKTDLAPDALPTNANGSYMENGPGTEVVDEIERINPGRTETLPLTLEAGNYVLICNIVIQTTVHFEEGMKVAFTVTEDTGQ